MELIRSLPESDLNRILTESEGGEYTEARALVQMELSRRAGVLLLLHTTDMPVWNGID